MQINIIPETPEEIRYVSQCLLGLADIREADTPAVPSVPENKPSRATKGGKKQLTASEAEAALFNAASRDKAPEPDPTPGSAGTAPAPEESGKAADSAPAEGLTHDVLREAFGNITDPGKREKVISGISKMGYNSIKALPTERLAEAYALMVG